MEKKIKIGDIEYEKDKLLLHENNIVKYACSVTMKVLGNRLSDDKRVEHFTIAVKGLMKKNNDVKGFTKNVKDTDSEDAKKNNLRKALLQYDRVELFSAMMYGLVDFSEHEHYMSNKEMSDAVVSCGNVVDFFSRIDHNQIEEYLSDEQLDLKNSFINQVIKESINIYTNPKITGKANKNGNYDKINQVKSTLENILSNNKVKKSESSYTGRGR